MPATRDWTLVFLRVAALWGAWRALSLPLRVLAVPDPQAALAQPGGTAIVVIAVASAVLWLVLLWCLLRPARIGLAVGFAAVMVGLFHGGASTVLLVRALPATRAVALTTPAGGDVGAVAAVLTPGGLWTSYGISVALAAAVALALWQRRAWFAGRRG